MGTTPDTISHTDSAAPSTGPVLVLRLKKKTQGRYPLDGPRLTMGRASRSDIVLDESSGVSRHHAHILVVDDEVVVEDLGSRNGTFVNGKLTTRRTLRPGDRIAIGHYRLHFIHERVRANDTTAPENMITSLFRLWGPAAVTADIFGCPLCHAVVDHEDGELTPGSETGEYVRIDARCAGWFEDPQTDAEDDAESGQDLAAEFAEENFPSLDAIQRPAADAVEEDEEDEEEEDEDELMARVERLVGLAPTSDDPEPDPEPEPADTEQAEDVDAGEPVDDDAADEALAAVDEEADPADAAHDARTKLLSRKPKTLRSRPARRKASRRSRLHR